MSKKIPGYNHCLLLFIAVVSSIAGCRSVQTISEADKSKATDPEGAVLSILENRSARFHTMKARKVDVDFYMNGVSEKVKGNIAIYRDSMIAVSVIPALGYELLRILCTEDSVIIINRPDKSFTASSFKYFQTRYKIPLCFSDLQAMLANKVFYYKEGYEDRVFEKKLNRSENNNLVVLDAFREGRRITNQGIEIDAEGQRLESMFIIDYDTKMKLGIKYQEFTEAGDILFPRQIIIDMVERNNSIKLELRYGQIIFDDSLNVEFSVPKNYTRGDI
jgi:hypothetical protein